MIKHAYCFIFKIQSALNIQGGFGKIYATTIQQNPAVRVTFFHTPARARVWGLGLEHFSSRVDEFEEVATHNRIWKQRLVSIGVSSAEEAKNLGLSRFLYR